MKTCRAVEGREPWMCLCWPLTLLQPFIFHHPGPWSQTFLWQKDTGSDEADMSSSSSAGAARQLHGRSLCRHSDGSFVVMVIFFFFFLKSWQVINRTQGLKLNTMTGDGTRWNQGSAACCQLQLFVRFHPSVCVTTWHETRGGKKQKQ